MAILKSLLEIQEFSNIICKSNIIQLVSTSFYISLRNTEMCEKHEVIGQKYLYLISLYSQ